MKKNSILFALITVISLSCSNEAFVNNKIVSDGNEKCDILLSKRLVNSDLKADTEKLLECGLDSVDLPLAGLIVIKKMQNKAEFDTLTYRGLIAAIRELKERNNK